MSGVRDDEDEENLGMGRQLSSFLDDVGDAAGGLVSGFMGLFSQEELSVSEPTMVTEGYHITVGDDGKLEGLPLEWQELIPSGRVTRRDLEDAENSRTMLKKELKQAQLAAKEYDG